MDNKIALIVDDEPDILELLAITLGRMNIDCQMADTLASAKQYLRDMRFDLCLTDMHLPDGNGIDLVTHIQGQYPDIPVAMITAFGSIETAISALKAGAFDFISKPIELSQLRDMIQQALKIQLTMREEANQEEADSQILGNSKPIKVLREQIKKVARSQAPVYISGESGSGKELAARLIHHLGPRSNKPFVPVNCGAIPSELMESEFFGHKKGSFTGAINDKQGLFQSAHGGTLFLDEVADLPLHMQVKLLRAIQEKSVRPVGSERELPIDVRILSATHKDLNKEANSGNFRQDMYYRINVIEIRIPTLRTRKSDIELLARHCLEKISDANNLDLCTISPHALEALNDYDFPGNVRELENILERASTLCEHNVIEAHDLKLDSTQPARVTGDSLQQVRAETVETPPETDAQLESLDDYLGDIEKKAILAALEKTRWNRTAAAEKLGISFRQMRHRLKKFGIE